MIKRFEYCIDTFWKYLKIHLEEVERVIEKIASPREAIKAAWRYGLISESEHEVLIFAVASRNLTAHTYNEELANEMIKSIPQYGTTMQAVVSRLKRDC